MHLPDEMDAETCALVTGALPATAREFSALIGMEATLALIREFGGMELRFPKSETGTAGARFAEIAEVVGYDNARRLAAEFGFSEKVFIPRCVKAVAILRNRALIQDFDRMSKGQSGSETVRQLVRKYGLTYRQIEKIVGRPLGE